MLTLPAARPLSEKDLISRCEIVDIWLRTRCGGLIEAHRDLERYRRSNARLSYLHRTVRDFLELPEIQARILKPTTGTAFSASQVLLQSSVLYIKWVMYPGDPKTHRKIWASQTPARFAQQGLQYALSDELENGKPQTLMLEELDRVCNALLRGSIEPPYSWADEKLYHDNYEDTGGDTAPRPNHRNSLISIAIACGLHSYVSRRIQLEPNLIRNKMGRPLLHYAVQETGTGQIHNYCVSELMINLLLTHGASPNHTYESISAWEHVLESIFKLLRKPDIPNEHLLMWTRIARLFLLHGANMVQCIGGDPEKSAHQVITAAFYDKFPEDTRDLQSMLVSSGQIKEMKLHLQVSSPHPSTSSSQEARTVELRGDKVLPSGAWRTTTRYLITALNLQCSMQNRAKKIRLTRQLEIESYTLRAPNDISTPDTGDPEAGPALPNGCQIKMQLPRLQTHFPVPPERPPAASAQELSLSKIYNTISLE